MGSNPHKCEICGADARIHVSSDPGAPDRVAHYCVRCAEADDLQNVLGRRSRNRSAVVMTLGFFVLLVSLFADYLNLGSEQGAGFRYAVILAVCATLIGVGALTRTATVLIMGLAFTGVAFLADLLSLGGAPGFGIQQRIGTAIGFLIILGGFFAFRRARRPSP